MTRPARNLIPAARAAHPAITAMPARPVQVRVPQPVAASPGSTRRFLLALSLLTACGVAGVVYGNQSFAPEMYAPAGSAEIGSALAQGKNVALFDLNFNIREVRDAQIARMPTKPDVVVLGASHWQEADRSLLPHKNYYNAHVHRDYYEDMLGVTEMFHRHGKLPRQMIISIRDNLFTDVRDRKDHLWLPGAPYARTMAHKLSIEPLSSWQTLPVQRWRELLSLPMFYGNVARWYLADEKPDVSYRQQFDGLDTLLPDGSIVWSKQHQQLFTRERTERLSIAFAEQNSKAPPKLDAKGIAAIDTLLAFLVKNNVEVYLAHPPFNPDYFDRVRNSPYMDGLRKVEQLTAALAKKYGLQIIGGFDPTKVGCTADMFIDAEHSNANCLRTVFDEFIELDHSFQARNINLSHANPLVMPTVETTAAALVASLGYGRVGVPQSVEPALVQRVVTPIDRGEVLASHTSAPNSPAPVAQQASPPNTERAIARSFRPIAERLERRRNNEPVRPRITFRNGR